jgi:hypothetical protein
MTPLQMTPNSTGGERKIENVAFRTRIRILLEKHCKNQVSDF